MRKYPRKYDPENKGKWYFLAQWNKIYHDHKKWLNFLSLNVS